jgi:hypothetical protein
MWLAGKTAGKMPALPVLRDLPGDGVDFACR